MTFGIVDLSNQVNNINLPSLRFKQRVLGGRYYVASLRIFTKPGKSFKEVSEAIVNMFDSRDVLLTHEAGGAKITSYVQSIHSNWCMNVTTATHPRKGIVMIDVDLAGTEPFVIESLARIKAAYPEYKFKQPKVKDDQVDVSFWRSDPRSGKVSESSRRLHVDLWKAIKANYPPDVRRQLDKLMKMENPTSGKLVVLHGPPGGGKTRSILSLMKAWQKWTSANVVTDPERLLNDSNYLNQIIFESIETGGWMFVVIEDGDEFLNVDAKDAKGQDIGRLLNLTDGIIGQGVKILLLISTNLKQDKMNPAVVRDGRCLAEIHYRPFTVEEAANWLVGHGKTKKKALQLAEGKAEDGEVTLANLYQLL